MGVKIAAPLFVLKFMGSFAQIVIRKAQHKQRIFKLKDVRKKMDALKQRVKDKLREA